MSPGEIIFFCLASLTYWMSVDEGESKKRKRGPKKAKDPNAPKRPPSAYLLFQNAVRATVKQDHPDWTNHEVLAEVSKRWADLSPQDKKVCLELLESICSDITINNSPS